MNNIFEIYDIKNIKIKSNFNSDAFWDYEHHDENYNKIKFFLCNSTYDNINIFYQNNYLDYYVNEINILEYL